MSNDTLPPTLEMFLKAMGVLPAKRKAPDVFISAKEQPKYVYDDPRDPVTGEVNF